MKKIISTLITLNLIVSPAMANEAFYTVKKGNDLSSVLKSLALNPVYGKHGSLKRIMNLNNIKNGDLIYPNQIIKLSKDSIKASKTKTTKKVIAQEEKSEVKRVAASELDVTRIVVVVPVKDEPYTTLTVSPRFSTYEINGREKSNNTNGYLNSNTAMGFEIDWTQNWTNHFETNLGLTQDYLSINPFTENRTLVNGDIGLFEAHLGAAYRVFSPLKIGLNLGYEEMAAYYASSPSEITVVKSSTPTAALNAELLVLKKGKLELDLIGQYKYITPFSINALAFDSGSGYLGAVRVKQNLGRATLSGAAFMSERKFGNNQAEFTTQNVGVKFGLGMDFK